MMYYLKVPHIFDVDDWKWDAIYKLDAVVYALTTALKNLTNEYDLLSRKVEAISEKSDLLAQNNKKRFKWINSHWELIDAQKLK